MEYKSNFAHFTCIIFLIQEKPLKLSQVTPVYGTQSMLSHLMLTQVEINSGNYLI